MKQTQYKCEHGYLAYPLSQCYSLLSKHNPEIEISDVIYYVNQKRLVLISKASIAANLDDYDIDVAIGDRTFGRPVILKESVPSFYVSQNPSFSKNPSISPEETFVLDLGTPDYFIKS